MQNKIKEAIDRNYFGYASFLEKTSWDINRLAYLQTFFTKLQKDLKELHYKLKVAGNNIIAFTIEEVHQELIRHYNVISILLTKTRIQDEWPDIILVLASSGKDIAICRLNTKFYLYQSKDKEMKLSNSCWCARNFIFKDINCNHTCVYCGCNYGIVQGCLGIFAEKERDEFQQFYATSWKQMEAHYWQPIPPSTFFDCRLFIHQAKIRPGSDRNGLCDGHARLIIGSRSIETPTHYATLSPIWNAVVNVDNIVLSGPSDWYTANPPFLVIELYDSDKLTSDDYLGCGILPFVVSKKNVAFNNLQELSAAWNADGGGDCIDVVKTRNILKRFQQLKTLSPPPLKWVPIALKGGIRAEVLISAEFIEITPKSTDTKEQIDNVNISFGIPSPIRPNMRNFILEVVFAGLRNYSNINNSGHHRIKVMMGDLVLSSGLSTTRMKNSMNFLVLYDTGIVSLPEQLEYWPAIIATDMDVSGKGGENTLGAVLVSNSKQFLQKDKNLNCVTNINADMESYYTKTTISDDETDLLIPKEKNGSTIRQFLSNVFTTKKSYENIPISITYDPNSILTKVEYNWWTKFYNTLNSREGFDEPLNLKHELVIYNNELEKEAIFSYMHDWAEPLQLVHGVRFKKNSVPKEQTYATLKMQIKLTQCQCMRNASGDNNEGVILRPLAAALSPKHQTHLLRLTEQCKIVVRLYIVQGLQFRPHDQNSQSDSYVKVQFGSKVISDRAHYIPNLCNPIFGKSFELEGSLPGDHMLDITILDRNAVRDEIIGSTSIDLEDRWRTKHRATVGLPKEYSKSGYNKWRDISTPFEILMDLCMKADISLPHFHDRNIKVDGVTFSDETKIETDEDLQERLSLIALKNLNKLPSFGYQLVPEHVETRSLYRPDCPGIEQGKLQLWIELYEGNVNVPPSIDLTPAAPLIYELRVIILRCADITLDETNIFGTKMSDIFVKGWCHDVQDVQETDIHYRSLNGEGMFNWRMIFPIKYCASEDMMIVKSEGGHYEEYEIKRPPVLYLQIWDNDVMSKDDFLGALEINLSNFLQPFENEKSCTLSGYTLTNNRLKFPFNVPGYGSKVNIGRKVLNLFLDKHSKGWFPMRGPVQQANEPNVANRSQNGKIELELELVSDVEATLRPVGRGRDPPRPLSAPVRPDTSFNPLLHPIKAFKKILFPAIRKYIIIVVLFVLIGLGAVLFFSKLPYAILGLA